jgi:hypothetical protein
MPEIIRLEKRNNKGNFVLVKTVQGFNQANLWIEKHKDEDIRAVAACGCIAYIAWSWEECGSHYHGIRV